MGNGHQRHRPQSLLFSLFGGVVALRDDVPPIPTAVFLGLLGELGVAEAATRATLARMTRRGLLERIQVGRAAQYRLTPAAEALVRDAGERVTSRSPFEHPDGEWTLLSYSMPESRRDLRHRVRATLTWAGFGSLRDGLWIAPGTVDVATVMADSGLTEALDHADWFAASPLPGVDVEAIVRRAWPIEEIRTVHLDFLQTWESLPDGEPLGLITLLGADWLRVLRSDPGLPACYLPDDWPAARSAAAYRRSYDALVLAARRALDRKLSLVAP